MIGIIGLTIFVIIGSVVTLRELYGKVKTPWKETVRKETKRK